MLMEIYTIIVVVLFGLAISDLIVGVSNDAVNFLNSAIGSQVAPRWVIMIIASLGMILGVMFSSGMMEVARKGIFHPEKFVMPELMVIFLAVMLTDVILLDLYNTFGLPTSTTVSVVFELLGAAVAVSFIKIHQTGLNAGEIINYINTAKALAIISGILISIIIAFFSGAFIQFLSRLLFSFDYAQRLKRYGAIWGGIALTLIIYFILIKGAKGASFITPQTLDWIQSHTGLILLASFVWWSAVLQLLMWTVRIHVLKVIVLVGTGALAMAFAANDLVNFIGVPLAGFASFNIARLNFADPLTATMEALAQPVRSNTLFLLVAGIVMVVTLWFSRKAQSVTKTEVSLGRQDEGAERFDSSALSRIIVRMGVALANSLNQAIPAQVTKRINSRFDVGKCKPESSAMEEAPSFDLLRASVNLVVASALISLGTSLKLPLSTTYVTFMVAMGSSLSDRAWGRESAVYRITGVLTVIGGWFFTALMAFTVSAIFAVLLYYFRLPALLVLIALASFFIYRTHIVHRRRQEAEKEDGLAGLAEHAEDMIQNVFPLFAEYFGAAGKLVRELFDGMFEEKRKKVRTAASDAKKLDRRVRRINSMILHSVSLPLRESTKDFMPNLALTVSALQEINHFLQDVSEKCFKHLDNNHQGFQTEQISDLREVESRLIRLFRLAEEMHRQKKVADIAPIKTCEKELQNLLNKFDKSQIKRIKNKQTKTRISMLYFRILTGAGSIAKHVVQLMEGYTQEVSKNS
ncbi:inorganic phosphate transporter [candidate division KSB1 bacterium]|nr:inorganic phosphate transporter [candidate division KSB1 bacterium]